MKRLNFLGISGIIGLISYTAMVVFSPLAYPGYDWMTMAVSDLGAVGAPSKELAHQLNSFYGPCSLLCSMAVWAGTQDVKSKLLKWGIALYAMMTWISDIGYSLFPWVADAPATNPQNMGHLIVTVLVVAFSIFGIIFTAIGANREGMKTLSILSYICFAFMMIGPIGTGLLPKAVFGLFERFSTFSAVVFNAILGWNLFKGNFDRAY